MNEKYDLRFSDEVQQGISELAEKYNLTLTKEDFWNFEKADPEIVIFKAAKKIVAMEKGTGMKDVTGLLKAGIKISQKTADELARDIKDSVALWVEIKNQKEEIEGNFQEELLQKIKSSVPPPKPKLSEAPPEINIKKVEIENVEEMGQNTKTEEKEQILSGKPIEQPQDKKPDPYKEPIE